MKKNKVIRATFLVALLVFTLSACMVDSFSIVPTIVMVASIAYIAWVVAANT